MPGIVYQKKGRWWRKGLLRDGFGNAGAPRTFPCLDPTSGRRLLVAAPKRRFLHFRADMHCLRGSGREELKDTILNLAMISSEAR